MNEIEAQSRLVATWAQIEDAIFSQLNSGISDPLQQALVIVPSVGHGRKLSQKIATQNGFGICSGIDFVTLHSFKRKLYEDYLAIAPDTDPWSVSNLSLRIAEILQKSNGQSWFAPLSKHLGDAATRPGRISSTARRIARLFLHYCEEAPLMLASWQKNEDADFDGSAVPDHQEWQPQIWRRLVESTKVLNPFERQDALIESIPEISENIPAPFLAGIITSLSESDSKLLKSLSEYAGLMTWQLGLPVTANNDFLARYGVERPNGKIDPPESGVSTMLRAVQASIFNDSGPGDLTADGTIQIHASHGPNRQVEVLRDALSKIFEDDQSLEPRDVLVLVPNLERFATYLKSAFQNDFSTKLSHPAKQLRVQLATASLMQTNPILDMIDQLLAMSMGRGHVSELLDFLTLPTVSALFDFSADEIELIQELFEKANVSWGIDSPHRSRYGLSSQTLGTWWNGVQRMLTGVLFADEPPTAVKEVAPLPQIESSMLSTIGKLAEAVARIRKSIYLFGQPGSTTDWIDRLTTAARELSFVGPLDEWQMSQAISKISTLSGPDSSSSFTLTAADVKGWIAEANRPYSARPNFGNGSLLVAQLGQLQAVEHRVICVLGLNDSDFPARNKLLGDDLVTSKSSINDAKRKSRQQLLDALLAAKDKFVVITQAASPRTGQKLAPPIAILDLLAACGIDNPQELWDSPDERLLISHPLSSQSKTNFDGANASFDKLAFSGANIETDLEKQNQETALWKIEFGNEILSELSLPRILKFLRNPAAELLSSASNLNLNTYEDETANELPIAPDGLSTYSIRSKIIDDLLSGVDINTSIYVAGLSGKVLLNDQGKELIDAIADEAADIAKDVLSARGTDSGKDINVTTSFSGRRTESIFLSADIRTWNDRVVIFRAGKLKAITLIEAWIQLCLLAVNGESAKGATIVCTDSTVKLSVPDSVSAEHWLSDLVLLVEDGLKKLIPLPIETAAAYTGAIFKGRASDSPDWRMKSAWHNFKGFGEYDSDPSWQHFFSAPEELFVARPEPLDPTPFNTDHFDCRFKQLAAWLFQPIRRAMLK